MGKTAGEIEADVFELISASPLKGLIQGRIYKEGTRPVNAKTEDLVISFLDGTNEQIQTGVLNLNTYVPDVKIGHGQLVRNITRCTEIEKQTAAAIDCFSQSEYEFTLDAIPKTYKAEGIAQHFVNTRLKFKRLTI